MSVAAAAAGYPGHQPNLGRTHQQLRMPLKPAAGTQPSFSLSAPEVRYKCVSPVFFTASPSLGLVCLLAPPLKQVSQWKERHPILQHQTVKSDVQSDPYSAVGQSGCGFNLDSISQKASQLEATSLGLSVLAAVGGAAAASLRLRVYLRTLINPPG